jgi:hypothetical protein
MTTSHDITGSRTKTRDPNGCQKGAENHTKRLDRVNLSSRDRCILILTISALKWAVATLSNLPRPSALTETTHRSSVQEQVPNKTSRNLCLSNSPSTALSTSQEYILMLPRVSVHLHNKLRNSQVMHSLIPSPHNPPAPHPETSTLLNVSTHSRKCPPHSIPTTKHPLNLHISHPSLKLYDTSNNRNLSHLLHLHRRKEVPLRVLP